MDEAKDRWVTIIDEDPASRAQLKTLVARENIAGCEVAEKPGSGPNIWVGDKTAPKILNISENDSFTKPVRAGEVLDRVRRLQTGNEKIKKVEIGPYELDPGSNELLVSDDRAIRITDKEKQLLLLLAEAGGKAVDRNVLLEKVWGYAPNLETHTLETHIYRLRQKIENDPAKPEILLTDGTGYKIS